MLLQRCWLSHIHHALLSKKTQQHTLTFLAKDGFLLQASLQDAIRLQFLQNK